MKKWGLVRFIKKLNPSHWIYLVVYFALLIIGLSLVSLGSHKENISSLAISIGGSIIATAIAGWILFLLVWIRQEKMRQMEILQNFGIDEIFKFRSVQIKNEYDQRLEKVKDKIDIIGFGLKALREDYHQEFLKWGQRAKVRILLLDFEYPSAEWTIAKQRDREEINNIGDIEREVRTFIRDCSDLIKNENNDFSIRLYRCLPTINMFRIDNKIFWGPYLIGDVSRNLPTFLLDMHGILAKRISEHFNKIWSDDDFSRPVPKEWINVNAK